MTPRTDLPYTCLMCHQPSDAPLCERCEAGAHELTVKALDTLAAQQARVGSHRAQKTENVRT